jgi:tRNA U34 2-thiouridine synthase MnmA/TrmU
LVFYILLELYETDDRRPGRIYSQGGRERGRHRGLTDLHIHSRDSYTVEEPSRRGELDDAVTIDIREGRCLVGGRSVERAEEAFVSIKIMDSQPADRTALEQ